MVASERQVVYSMERPAEKSFSSPRVCRAVRSAPYRVTSRVTVFESTPLSETWIW
jgi:hypothetical protein